MIIGNFLIRFFPQSPVLKKIGNSFSKLFAITKIEEPCIISGILLVNQK